MLKINCKKLLLHSCCAVCSGGVIKRLYDSEINFSVFFYNPNIYPYEEYLKRKEDNKNFAVKHGIEFIDQDWENEKWLDCVKGLENEPEKGRRCEKCFLFRLSKSAEYANANGFDVLTSCFGISKYKDKDQVNRSGHQSVMPYKGLSYWDYNWRKQGGSDYMETIAKQENFYRQAYCGCLFSASHEPFPNRTYIAHLEL